MQRRSFVSYIAWLITTCGRMGTTVTLIEDDDLPCHVFMHRGLRGTADIGNTGNVEVGGHTHRPMTLSTIDDKGNTCVGVHRREADTAGKGDGPIDTRSKTMTIPGEI